MQRLVPILLLFAGHLSVLRGEPFEQAEVTKAINVVSLLPQDVQAAPGDIVKGDTALQTGGYSRAELQFSNLTITRVGSNSLFRFVRGTREIILDSGTMLFSAPAGAGGGKVRAGFISAAVTGSEFMISNVGKVKVICLSHKVAVYFTANPKVRVELLPGQMLDIAAGANRKMPPVTTINLGKLLGTSLLTESGGFNRFPVNRSSLKMPPSRRRHFPSQRRILRASPLKRCVRRPTWPTILLRNRTKRPRLKTHVRARLAPLRLLRTTAS